MAKKVYKMLVPKAGTANELGSEARLYKHEEVVETTEQWQEDLMESFVENGFAMEVKMDSADQTADIEAEVKEEPKRARNKKGQLVGDDPDTPDVNEAWEGGKAPTKKSTKKKS